MNSPCSGEVTRIFWPLKSASEVSFLLEKADLERIEILAEDQDALLFERLLEVRRHDGRGLCVFFRRADQHRQP